MKFECDHDSSLCRGLDRGGGGKVAAVVNLTPDPHLRCDKTSLPLNVSGQPSGMVLKRLCAIHFT